MTSRRLFNSMVVGASLAGTSAAWSKTETGPSVQTSAGRTAYQAKNVSFSSSGETIAGKLLTPVKGGLHPAVVIMGPVASVKEQSPLQYATQVGGTRAGSSRLRSALPRRQHGRAETPGIR